MTLANKTALITGGKRIGAVSPRSSRAGEWTWRSPTSGRRTKPRRRLKRYVTRDGERLCCRRTSSEVKTARLWSMRPLQRSAARRSINMASVYRSFALADIDEARWDESLDVDLKAANPCAHAAIPYTCGPLAVDGL